MKILRFLCGCFVLQVAIFLLAAAPGAETTLTLEDCQKCHLSQAEQIASGGMAHRDQVTCLDCHVGHPPPALDNIPACGDCHSASPHAEMIDCTACHQRKKDCQACHQVHQPLAWPSGEIPGLHCQACHPEAVELMEQSSSKHRDLECSYCHPAHRVVQDCSDCHGRPHSAGTHNMFQCVVCHSRAHDLNTGNDQ